MSTSALSLGFIARSSIGFSQVSFHYPVRLGKRSDGTPPTYQVWMCFEKTGDR